MKFKDYGTRTYNLRDTKKKMSVERQISAITNPCRTEEIYQKVLNYKVRMAYQQILVSERLNAMKKAATSVNIFKILLDISSKRSIRFWINVIEI